MKILLFICRHMNKVIDIMEMKFFMMKSFKITEYGIGKQLGTPECPSVCICSDGARRKCSVDIDAGFCTWCAVV